MNKHVVGGFYGMFSAWVVVRPAHRRALGARTARCGFSCAIETNATADAMPVKCNGDDDDGGCC